MALTDKAKELQERLLETLGLREDAKRASPRFGRCESS